jgi:hypothetical protein
MSQLETGQVLNQYMIKKEAKITGAIKVELQLKQALQALTKLTS